LLERDLGGFVVAPANSKVKPTVTGTGRLDPLKPGIHFSSAAVTSFALGFVWCFKPHIKTFKDLLPDESAVLHSGQRSTLGTDAKLTHFELKHPWGAKHVQQDQRPRWRRFQASKAKNNLQSIILWESCPFRMQVHAGRF
jgi:hypothetical protein